MFHVPLDEAVRRSSGLDRDLARLVDDRVAPTLRKRQHTQDVAHGVLSRSSLELAAKGADVRACGFGALQVVLDGLGVALAAVVAMDTVVPRRLTGVLP